MSADFKGFTVFKHTGWKPGCWKMQVSPSSWGWFLLKKIDFGPDLVHFLATLAFLRFGHCNTFVTVAPEWYKWYVYSKYFKHKVKYSTKYAKHVDRYDDACYIYIVLLIVMENILKITVSTGHLTIPFYILYHLLPENITRVLWCSK